MSPKKPSAPAKSAPRKTASKAAAKNTDSAPANAPRRDAGDPATLKAAQAEGLARAMPFNSGKPLAIAGNSTADGAKAVQQSGNATWTVSAGQNGSFTLRYDATGKVLDVNGSSSTTGLQLQQWTANGGTNQQWFLRSAAGGFFTIANVGNGLVADVYGQSTSDGAQVVQWTANGGVNQQWQLLPQN